MELQDLDSFELFVDVDKILVETLRINAVARRANEAAKRRVSRQRQKEAREALRLQAGELSRQLEHLTRAKQDKIRYATRSSQFVLWKAIARRQREMRLYAEAEQRQLAVLVNRQAAYIQELRDVAQKRLAHTGSGFTGIDAEEELCLASMQELDDTYKRFDEVYEQAGMASLVGEDVVYTVRRKPDNAVEYFEKKTISTLPSSLSDSGQLFWTIAKLAFSTRMKGDQRCTVRERSNTLVVQFQEQSELAAGTKVSMLQRGFVKRYREEKRVVHLWKFVSEGEGIFSGLQSEETGWCCLRPTGHSGAVIEMYQHWVPMHFSSVRSQAADEDFHQVLKHLSETTTAELITSLDKWC